MISLRSPLLTGIALVGVLVLLIPQARAAETLIHYRVNVGDDLTSAVPNLGTLGDGIPGGPGGVAISFDPPSVGVPPEAGNSAISFLGTNSFLGPDGAGGILSPEANQLQNSKILAAGGFTYEAWFRYDGGPGVNAIIDYAGTEKLTRPAAGSEVQMQTNVSITHGIGAAANGEWHYAAVVFDNVSLAASGTSVTGDYTFYFDDTQTPAGTATGVTISNFGDSLGRTIAVGMHPEGFSGDFFDGLIFEPRVTLGALPAHKLLFQTNRITVTTLKDEMTSDFQSTGLSLREAIAQVDATTPALIDFDPALSGGTIGLTINQLIIADDRQITIDASGLPGGMTIDGNDSYRIFKLNGLAFGHTTSLALYGLTLTNGKAPDGSPGGDGEDGGGILLQDANLKLSRCTIHGCRAGAGMNGGPNGFGGAIFLQNNASATLDSSTITNNPLGVTNQGELTVHACTITDPVSAQNIGPDHVATQNIGHSIIGGTAPSSFNATGPNLFNNNSNPRLMPLGHYGGPTPTLPPLPGSPAIDAAGTTNPGGTDQRGLPRFAGSQLDLGAVELRSDELELVWDTDHDGDGHPFGMEFALGTDPFSSDATHANNPSITTQASGQSVINFGHNPDANGYVLWKLTRSTDLINYDVDFYQYDVTSESFSDSASGGFSNGAFQISDPNIDDVDRYFYRFEAVLSND